MKSECNRPITIEDLLRLKRAERPPAEFWTDFDRELRAKQLAALVEKRPWWRGLPHVSFPRFRLLMGASAVLAITFLSLRGYKAVPPVQQPERDVSPAVALVSPVEATVTRVNEGATTEAAFVSQPIVASMAQPDVVPIAPAALASDAATTANDISRVIALGGGSAAEAHAPLQTRSVRYGEGSLAIAPSPDRFASRGLLSGTATGFEDRVMPSRVTIEPLQQMSLPSDTRRSRLLTAMVSTASFETSPRATERAASRIADERLYDQVHRFGAKGDRVQVKF